MKKRKNIDLGFPFEFGSILKIPDTFWTSRFARRKHGIHPAVIERVQKDSISAVVVPGTSKNYKTGSCVFKTKLNNPETTYFLIMLSMTCLIERLDICERGWNGLVRLSKKQLNDFEWQINICKGYKPVSQDKVIKLNSL